MKTNRQMLPQRFDNAPSDASLPAPPSLYGVPECCHSSELLQSQNRLQLTMRHGYSLVAAVALCAGARESACLPAYHSVYKLEPVKGLTAPQVGCYHHISTHEYIPAKVLDKDLQLAAHSVSGDDTGNFYKHHK